MNRKFYRQGVYYYVDSFEVENQEEGYVEVKIAPDTWMTRNAHRRGKMAFIQNYELVDTAIPKYHDFKVFLDSTQWNLAMNGNSKSNLKPSLYGGIGNESLLSQDDWNYSKLVSLEDTEQNAQAPKQMLMHLVGNHQGTAPFYNSIGLIHSYHKSRPIPDPTGTPLLPSGHQDDPIHNLFDGQHDDVAQALATNLDTDNDETPYNSDYYTGESDNGLTVLRRLSTGDQMGGDRTDIVKGACIPFGLIRIDNTYTTSWRFIVNVKKGTYHGVHAERC